jgi:hypothetical protein
MGDHNLMSSLEKPNIQLLMCQETLWVENFLTTGVYLVCIKHPSYEAKAIDFQELAEQKITISGIECCPV